MRDNTIVVFLCSVIAVLCSFLTATVSANTRLVLTACGGVGR